MIGATCDCCGLKTSKPVGPVGRLCGACKPNVCEECASYTPELSAARVPCEGEDS